MRIAGKGDIFQDPSKALFKALVNANYPVLWEARCLAGT